VVISTSDEQVNRKDMGDSRKRARESTVPVRSRARKEGTWVPCLTRSRWTTYHLKGYQKPSILSRMRSKFRRASLSRTWAPPSTWYTRSSPWLNVAARRAPHGENAQEVHDVAGVVITTSGGSGGSESAASWPTPCGARVSSVQCETKTNQSNHGQKPSCPLLSSIRGFNSNTLAGGRMGHGRKKKGYHALAFRGLEEATWDALVADESSGPALVFTARPRVEHVPTCWCCGTLASGPRVHVAT